MGVESAQRRFHESVAERLEALAGAVPGKAVFQQLHSSAECLLVAAPHQRVGAIGADDQVGLAQCAKVGDGSAVMRFQAHGAGARLQDAKQRQASDAGVAHAVDVHLAAFQMKNAVAAEFQGGEEGGMGFAVLGVQEFQRPLGESHAEAEGGVMRVLLVDVDLRCRVGALQEIGKV